MQERASEWAAANQHYLLAAIDVVRAALEQQANSYALEDGDRLPDRRAEAAATSEEMAAAMPSKPALDRLCEIFNLSSFERGILLLGAGIETDATFALLCAAAQNDGRREYPTFRLALDTLPDAHWSALSPSGPLRRWRMLEVGPGTALASCPLRLTERVLHELLGVQYLDDRLAGAVEPVPEAREIAPSHRALAERLAGVWKGIADASEYPAVQLVGGNASDRRAVAAAACGLLERELRAMSATTLPTKPDDLEALRRTWELEAALGHSVLLLESDGLTPDDRPRQEAVAWIAEHTHGGVILSNDQRYPGGHRPLVTIEVGKPSTEEQRELWHDILKDHLNDQKNENVVQRLATQFHLGAPAIQAAGADAVARHDQEGADLGDALWEACRLQARPQLSHLAQRIVPSATWEHMVLPGPQKTMLNQMIVHVRQRHQVYESWGFDGQGGRGLGVTALFSGSSGTGKTMAAEVLANDLNLDLYRVDLSAVVSKYIGETEKNLRQIFDAAETGGAILLFDEADALFGKRSDVKDSHDRHANVEVSYLLQRMEAYRGLAILTTNIKGAMDVAFTRRLRFIVNFPFPDTKQRAEIWRRVFPPDTPTRGLVYERLAGLNATGGLIRNIALTAAFLAADAGEPVTMHHLLQAVKAEYAKIDRQLSPADVAGWTHRGPMATPGHVRR